MLHETDDEPTTEAESGSENPIPELQNSAPEVDPSKPEVDQSKPEVDPSKPEVPSPEDAKNTQEKDKSTDSSPAAGHCGPEVAGAQDDGKSEPAPDTSGQVAVKENQDTEPAVQTPDDKSGADEKKAGK